MAFTTLSAASGISSSTGTHSIWMVTQCNALRTKHHHHHLQTSSSSSLQRSVSISDLHNWHMCVFPGWVQMWLISPDPVLRSQIFLLIVSGLRTKHTLIETSHDVLLHLVHHSLHLLRGTYRRTSHTHVKRCGVFPDEPSTLGAIDYL